MNVVRYGFSTFTSVFAISICMATKGICEVYPRKLVQWDSSYSLNGIYFIDSHEISCLIGFVQKSNNIGQCHFLLFSLVL